MLKLAKLLLVILAANAVMSCARNDSSAPTPTNQDRKPKAGDVRTYSNYDVSGRLAFFVKDSLIAPVAKWPDSLVAIRLVKQTLSPVTGQLVNDPTLAPKASLVTFANVLYNDSTLRTGPDPITFKSLEDFMTKANLSLADIYFVISGDFDANARKWEFVESCYKKLKTAYPQGFGFGSDWEDLLVAGNISTTDFFTAVDNASMTDNQLLDLMEQRQASFNLIKVRWLDSGDTTLTGLSNTLAILKTGPLRTSGPKFSRDSRIVGNLDYGTKLLVGAGVGYRPTLLGNPDRNIQSYDTEGLLNFRSLFNTAGETEEKIKLVVRGKRHNGISADYRTVNAGDLYVSDVEVSGSFFTTPSIWAYIKLSNAWADYDTRPNFKYFRIVYKYNVSASCSFMHNLNTDVYISEYLYF